MAQIADRATASSTTAGVSEGRFTIEVTRGADKWAIGAEPTGPHQ